VIYISRTAFGLGFSQGCLENRPDGKVRRWLDKFKTRLRGGAACEKGRWMELVQGCAQLKAVVLTVVDVRVLRLELLPSIG
jgi:hypothetical protein